MYARKSTKKNNVITSTTDFISSDAGFRIAEEQYPALTKYADKHFFIGLYILVNKKELYWNLLNFEDMDAFPLTWDVSDIYYLDDGNFKTFVAEKKKNLQDEYEIAIKDKIEHVESVDDYITFRCLITKYSINCFHANKTCCFFTTDWYKMRLQTEHHTSHHYEIRNGSLCIVADQDVAAGTELFRQKVAYDDTNMIHYGTYVKNNNPSTFSVVLNLNNCKNPQINAKYKTHKYHLTKIYAPSVMTGTRELMSALRVIIAYKRRNPKFVLVSSDLDIKPESFSEEFDVLNCLYKILLPQYEKRKKYSTQIIRNKHIVGYLTRSLDLLCFWLNKLSEIADVINPTKTQSDIKNDLSNIKDCVFTSEYVYDLMRLC